MQMTLSLMPNDVLCGRGGKGGVKYNSMGKTIFRSLVTMNKVSLASAM